MDEIFTRRAYKAVSSARQWERTEMRKEYMGEGSASDRYDRTVSRKAGNGMSSGCMFAMLERRRQNGVTMSVTL